MVVVEVHRRHHIQMTMVQVVVLEIHTSLVG